VRSRSACGHEIHHRPGWQQPDALLPASGQLDDLVHQTRADLSGQRPEPNRAQLVRHAADNGQPPAVIGRKRQHGHGTLSGQRSSSAGECDLGRPQSYRGLRCKQAATHADGNGEPLAILLRPGNAGSNTAADHIEAVKLALAQLPPGMRVLVRADSGGGTHEFLAWLTAPRRRLQYSVGFTITDEVQQAIAKVPGPGVDTGL
jgi:hypothetical protein